ncbi:MAG: phosphoenolpyruvate carboxykinase (GTP) [Candidatus Thorarchaeota archaeon]|nr:MAG: phosphoenolpyruvate carboxykinase (GTP) [Candidatus Thorarchaeota archaeon]
MSILESSLTDANLRKLLTIPNQSVHRFIADAIELCSPMKVFVCDDSRMDVEYIRRTAIARGEETPLAIPTHTVHFDGLHDQARDREQTVYLVPKGDSLGEHLLQMDREEGLELARKRLKGSMENKKMVVRFFCLGPRDSVFSIPCVQITDSFYVAHSEDLLYRRGYDFFRRLTEDAEIFWMLHSSGKLMHSVSIDWQRRGVAIDYKENTVYSYNTQYAGNTIGLKKLALRLAIRRADRERWLAEHMFVMAVHGPNRRKTYISGAFPSGSGKTSTSMIPGGSIVGDDLAYIRNINGAAKAVNVERGIFGIIRSVSAKDDPVIWEVLNSHEPAIFSNVLVSYEGIPYWLNDGRTAPNRGVNFSGDWFEGKKDVNGEEIPLAHKNARYTIGLEGLSNVDKTLEDPNGVELGAIIYGGRDPDTCVPIQESFDWIHGVVTIGASLESESTAATLGPSGIRKFQPFSNMDFISIPLGRYIQNHLDFGEFLQRKPRIYGVNYFLRDTEGDFLNGKEDKRVWLQWIDLRVHNEVEAIKTPTGLIPRYDDLSSLFREYLDKEYTREQYDQQFMVRVPELLAKLDRIESEYRDCVGDTPALLATVLEEQRQRLIQAKSKFGDYISPNSLQATVQDSST